MADFDTAFEYLMRWEDDGMTGKVTTDAGGRTRFGIAEKYYPYLTSTGFYDSLPKDKAMQYAKSTYRDSYWHWMQGDKINSQELANKLISLGANLGMVRVIRWAQDGSGVKVDGQVGPGTLAAWNADSATPFHAISIDAEAHYRQRAESDPANTKYLNGWLRRAQDPATLEAA